MSSYRERMSRKWDLREAEEHALSEHPEFKSARAVNGLTPWFEFTWVVQLWRTDECRWANEPPAMEVEGYRS